MRVAGRAPLITPVASSNESLGVELSIPTHPRRPSVTEAMEVDPRQAIVWYLPTNRATNRAGDAERSKLRARQQVLEVTRLGGSGKRALGLPQAVASAMHRQGRVEA
jgi:hypothetical protein